jgi:hypothetical protein
MDYNFNFNTLMWKGEYTYGPYGAVNWYSIGGPEHPMFKTLLTRIENEVPEIKQFKTYVNGGLLEDWMSWDIDITLTGEYRPALLKTIFEKVLTISFEMHLWVDLRYQEVLWRPDLMTEDDYQPMKAWCYELHNYFSKDGEETILDFYEPVDGLYRRLNVYPFKKHVERIEKGYIYQPPIELFN